MTPQMTMLADEDIRDRAVSRLFRDNPSAEQPGDFEVQWNDERSGVVTLTNVNGPIVSYRFRLNDRGVRLNAVD